jgi:LEA14-like dessication related protein
MRRHALQLISALASLLVGCATGPAPAVSLVDLEFTGATAFETGAVFTIRIQNQTPEILQFKGAVHRVALDRVEVGSGTSNSEFEVPPFGETIQEVTIHFSNLLLVTRLRGMIDARAVDYRLDSTLYPASGFGRSHVVKQGHLRLDDFNPNSPAQLR